MHTSILSHFLVFGFKYFGFICFFYLPVSVDLSISLLFCYQFVFILSVWCSYRRNYKHDFTISVSDSWFTFIQNVWLVVFNQCGVKEIAIRNLKMSILFCNSIKFIMKVIITQTACSRGIKVIDHLSSMHWPFGTLYLFY